MCPTTREYGEAGRAGTAAPVSIVVIGGTDQVHTTASELESSHEAFQTSAIVTTADSSIEGRLPEALDCIVCDHTLNAAARQHSLSTIAKHDSYRCPVFVVVDAEDGAYPVQYSDIVTDYIPRRQLRHKTIVSQGIVSAVEAYRQRQHLSRADEEKKALLRILRTNTSHESLGQSFCEFLVSERSYQSAWIGTAESTTGLTGQWVAGETGYIDAVLEPAPPADTTEPAVRAFETGEPQAVVPDESADTEWQAVGETHGINSAVSAPIQYQDYVFGAVSVYNGPQTDDAVAFLSAFAETVGFALRAVTWYESLLSTTPVAVEVELTDETEPLVAALQALPDDTRLTVLTVTPQEESVTYIIQTVGPSAAELVEAHERVAEEVLILADEPLQAEVTFGQPTAGTVAATQGGQLVDAFVSNGGIVMTIATRGEAHIERLVDGLESEYEDLSIRAIRRVEAEQPSIHETVFTELTTRQQQILEFAYFNGYFERPRGHNLTQIAEKVGLSRQTVTQHLRAGERKVFSKLFQSQSNETDG